MQVDEGAEEIRKWGTQENEVAEWEIDWANFRVRIPKQSLATFHDGQSRQHNQDWKQVLKGKEQVERGHAEPLQRIEGKLVAHDQIGVIEMSDYLVAAAWDDPEEDPLVVGVEVNHAEEKEVGGDHIHNEVTLEGLDSESVMRNFNKCGKFEQLVDTLDWGGNASKNVLIVRMVVPEFAKDDEKNE